MSKNREGSVGRSRPLEWGSKARKNEARLRGLNNTARRDAIAEQVVDASPDEWRA